MNPQSAACNLTNKKCVPCEGGTPPLTEQEYQPLLAEIHGWKVIGHKQIQKDFAFKNFKKTMHFVNTIADLAESEGHHPDLNIHDWDKLTITLSTHAIGGLSENDFILAAKIDQLPQHD